jgi:hypothetical protein
VSWSEIAKALALLLGVSLTVVLFIAALTWVMPA